MRIPRSVLRQRRTPLESRVASCEAEVNRLGEIVAELREAADEDRALQRRVAELVDVVETRLLDGQDV